MGRHIFWNDSLIKEKILEAAKALKLNRIPTLNELSDYYGNRRLAHVISRRGGIRTWAKKLDLPCKSIESTEGYLYEQKAIEDIYKHTGLKSAEMRYSYPYDLYVDGSVKVDVKMSHQTLEKKGVNIWTFCLDKKYPTCDFFIFYCIKDNEEVEKILIIPSDKLAGLTQLSVGNDSRYNSFKDRWDYIVRFNAYCKALAKNI